MASSPATPEKMTLDRNDGSATIALYRAVLGPLHTDYYLKAFTHFDVAGQAGVSWNWSAALLSLNWMLFRQLWTAALAYIGGLVAAALLLVGIARLVFQVSPELQWLLAGIALLLSVTLPGAFGNAWLYAACNQKMERALIASATLDEACVLLAARAVGRRQMAALLVGNLALAALLEALVFYWPHSHSLAPASTASSSIALASRVSQGAVQVVAAPTPAPAASAPASTVATPAEEKFLINVGLFANEKNAHHAMLTLQGAKLPARSQKLKFPMGTRTRVRVGPFASRAEADRAAEKIHALKLEALVIAQ